MPAITGSDTVLQLVAPRHFGRGSCRPLTRAGGVAARLSASLTRPKKLKPRGLDHLNGHLNGHFAPEESETCASTQSKPSGSRRIRTSPSWKFIPTKG